MWWAMAGLAVLTGFLLLAILGALRELALLRSDLAALSPSHSPPLAAAPELHPSVAASLERREGDVVDLVAFLAPDCAPCWELTEGLADAVAAGRIEADRVLTVVSWADDADCERYAERFPWPSLLDPAGEIAEGSRVHGTPTFMFVERSSGSVVNYSQGGRLQWIIDQISETKSLAPV